MAYVRRVDARAGVGLHEPRSVGLFVDSRAASLGAAMWADSGTAVSGAPGNNEAPSGASQFSRCAVGASTLPVLPPASAPDG
jgi:hypothetical protein